MALGLAFILEIIFFIGFAALGLLLPVPHVVQLALCAALLIVLFVFWGKYMAPRAPNPLPLKFYYTAKVLVYGPAAFMIFRLYGQGTGIALVVAGILNELALHKHNATRLKA